MALILGMLGGAAVVEIHRAITGNGNKAKGASFLNQKKKQQEMLSVIDALKAREKELEQSIRNLEEEVEGHAHRNELSEAERNRVERVCAQLREQLAEAEAQYRDVCKKYQELEERNAKTQEREEVLEGCVESLKAENSMLISQFERLKVKHEEETAAFEIQLKTLQQNVSKVLTKYIENSISVKGMSEELNRLGVEFACPQEVEVMAKAVTVTERKAAVGQLQLQVDQTSFFNQIHLTSSPTRAAQLFFSSTSAARDVEDKTTTLRNKVSMAHNDVDTIDTIAALHSPPVKQQQQKKKAFFGKAAKGASSKQALVEIPVILSGSTPSSERESISV